MTPEQQAAVVREAREWLATPYHHQGAIRGVGVDCAYLLIRVYHACGLIPDIDPRPYPADWHLHRSEQRYLSWVEQYAEQVDDPQPGDVALYQYGRCISHGAIVINWPTIIHAYKGEGCVLDDGASGKMADRLVGFWRLREVPA